MDAMLQNKGVQMFSPKLNRVSHLQFICFKCVYSLPKKSIEITAELIGDKKRLLDNLHRKNTLSGSRNCQFNFSNANSPNTRLVSAMRSFVSLSSLSAASRSDSATWLLLMLSPLHCG